jgi:hypothetical protein
MHLTRLEQARPGKGYFVSKQWCSNFRRFVESLSRQRKASRLSSSSGSSSGKSQRRPRSESNVMPPWALVNADITCEHGESSCCLCVT